jgi:ABC-type transporter MlaC component
MPNDAFPLSRRTFVAGSLLAGAALSVPRLAYGLDVESARALIDKAIGAVNETINSGKSEQAMYGDFEAIFARYADVPAIARSALGVASRSASDGQMSSFTKAYQGYVSRKYGRRFREFIGGKIEVTDARVGGLSARRGTVRSALACVGQVGQEPVLQHHHRRRQHAGVGTHGNRVTAGSAGRQSGRAD